LLPTNLKNSIRWINRNGASLVAAILLGGWCALTHTLAALKIDITGGHFASVDERTLREIRWITLIGAHLWLVIAYFVLFLAALMYLKVRGVRSELQRLSFLALASPTIIYSLACMHIGCKLVAF
jgi:hypothetical protein